MGRNGLLSDIGWHIILGVVGKGALDKWWCASHDCLLLAISPPSNTPVQITAEKCQPGVKDTFFCVLYHVYAFADFYSLHYHREQARLKTIHLVASHGFLMLKYMVSEVKSFVGWVLATFTAFSQIIESYRALVTLSKPSSLSVFYSLGLPWPRALTEWECPTFGNSVAWYGFKLFPTLKVFGRAWRIVGRLPKIVIYAHKQRLVSISIGVCVNVQGGWQRKLHFWFVTFGKKIMFWR